MTDSINQARAGLHDSLSTYNDQLKGELASLADGLQKVGADTETLAGSLEDTADSLGASTDSLAANLATAEASLRKTAETLRTAGKPARPGPRRPAARPGHRRHRRSAPHHRRQPGRHRPVSRRADATWNVTRCTPWPTTAAPAGPFYTSLALWIGAIFMVALMSVTVSPARQAALTKKFGRAPRPGELYLGRYGVFCLLGLAQALIVGLGNVFFLGVECEHFWLYLAALLSGIGGVHEPGVRADGVLRQHRQGACHHRTRAATGRRRRPHAGADAVGPAVPGNLPVAALRSFHAARWEGAMAGIYGDQYLVQMGLLAAILAPSLVLGLVLRRPVIRLNDWCSPNWMRQKFL
ncbi:MAG: hypothetical protein ACLTSX_13475 [Collinsella sp.]